MRVAQTILAVALVTAGVAADTNDAAVKQSHASVAKAQEPAAKVASHSPATEPVQEGKAAAAAKLPASSPSTEPVATPAKAKSKAVKAEAAKAEPAPAKKETEKTEAKKPDSKKASGTKDIVEKVKAVTNLAFGKVERKKERVSKQGAEYVRKQKSADEISADASGSKQPASLSDPKVNLMEAMTDLVKRYAGQATPDKAQLREDIKTVFESRAEKGDLTTKHFRQAYTVRELTPNGVGKPKSKEKRDLESRDLESDAEIDITARDAEAEDELDVMAREADPEAEVYEDDVDLATREFAEDEDAYYFARAEDGTPSAQTSNPFAEVNGHGHAATTPEQGFEHAKDSQDSLFEGTNAKSPEHHGSDVSEDEQAAMEKKKAALKKALKQLVRKQRLAKKYAAKKRMLAKKLAAKRKAAAYAAEEGSGEFSTPIPPTRPERPFYRAPAERRSVSGAMHYPRGFEATMGRMW